jgi:SP family myo-inositol transporter-like MFS transporter 13
MIDPPRQSQESISSNKESEQEALEKAPILKPGSESSRQFCNLYAVIFFAAIGGFLFGFDTGVISGALLYLKIEFSLNDWQQEFVVSAALVGAIVGAFFGGPLGDRLGRRPVVAMASILFIVGSIILAFSWSFVMLLVGRLIVGMGIGVASNIVPVYIAEISPAQSRGALVTVNVLCITFGQFISYLTNSAFSYLPQGWRWMLGIAAVPGAVQLIGLLCVVPESPRWLISKGRDECARNILIKFRPHLSSVDSEIEDIKASLRQESNSYKELFAPGTRRALVLGVLLQAFQQFAGINTAMYYSATILQMAGYKDPQSAIWLSDAVAFTNALFTIISIVLIDRIGRRKLLFVSLGGTIIGLLCLGVAFFIASNYGIQIGPFALGSLVVYVMFFAIGMGPVPWTVNSEIFPLKIRSLGNSIGTT